NGVTVKWVVRPGGQRTAPRGRSGGQAVLTVPEKVVFVLLAAASLYYAYLGFARVVRVVARGQVGPLPRTDSLPTRVVQGALKALSQRTVFRARPAASTFHAFVFYGFVLYLLVNV